ncbi:hypothetical protein [Streptomyces sp. 7-21]|jgi:hypothetical protein|uniref:hypothetical protein n=1 Tax=Streptomyces sp. 7-21 TaxID=2802283 RepID=UPI001F3EAE62|nr:hypothetical protein [Streptomyces sp. 7-21]
MHEARYSEERGWYVVDPWGQLVHLERDGEVRAALFGDDRQAAADLAARLNRASEPRRPGAHRSGA